MQSIPDEIRRTLIEEAITTGMKVLREEMTAYFVLIAHVVTGAG